MTNDPKQQSPLDFKDTIVQYELIISNLKRENEILKNGKAQWALGSGYSCTADAVEELKRLKKENAELKAQLATAVEALKEAIEVVDCAIPEDGMGYVYTQIDDETQTRYPIKLEFIQRSTDIIYNLSNATQAHNEAMIEKGRREVTLDLLANEAQKQGLYESTKEEQHDE